MTSSSERFGLDHLIDRPSLRSTLDEAFDRRLSLIVAPAGAGKTTLLRQWSAAHPNHAFVFLDIEAADDRPAHFTRRLVDALAAVEPDIARIVRDGGLGAPLISALAAAEETMPDVVIVVDDAHRFSNVQLVAELGELAGQTPRNVHLVVSSRSDPPIALGRYRLDDELLELRQAELAFNDEEAAELLERIVGHPLTSFNVRALRERTEGWAAGLQLAGLNLRHEPDPDAFVAAFGGSDRLVADYLGEEVLAFLPAERRDLLLRMSALDDMCAGLVQATTGCVDAQSVLEELERDSMFLVRMDGHREWFRFHHLFRDLLRSRLGVESASAERQVLSAAADWQLARGHAKCAVEYLLRAQSWDKALEAILANAEDVVAHGDILTVVRWMLRIPEPVRSGRINEALLSGALQAVNDTAVGASTLARLVPGNAVGSIETTPTGLGSLVAEMLETTDRLHVGVGSAAPIRPASTLQQALVAGARAFFLRGDMEQARELLSRSLVEPGASLSERVSALSTLSLVEAWTGETDRAEKLIREVLLTAREARLLAHPVITDAYLATVLTALGRGEPSVPGATANQLQATAAVPETARALRAGGAIVRTPTPTVLFERAVSALTLGDTEQARGVVRAWEDLVPEPDPLSVVQRHILLAGVAVSDNAPDEGMRQLTEAVRVAEIHGMVGVFVRAGPTILKRLHDVAGPQAAFRDVILARARQSSSPALERDLRDPLTDREMEILSYLPTRFTNVELAQRCFVSVNTIKTHMVHIYRKLDATNRDAAIDRARVLGLL